MKKEIKVVAIVLAALIIFLSGFGIGATKGINVNVKYEGGSADVGATTPTQPTTQPSTQASTEAPTQDSEEKPDAEKPSAEAPKDGVSIERLRERLNLIAH